MITLRFAAQELYRRDNLGTEHEHLRRMILALGSAEGADCFFHKHYLVSQFQLLARTARVSRKRSESSAG